jgi:lipid-binding SYLF domain-containing protein
MPMTTRRHIARLAAGLPFATAAALASRPAAASGTRAEIDTAVQQALTRLRGMENAAPLVRHAHAMLIFPRILSGGFIIGGQFGEGALLRGERTEGYYNIAGASFGFLAGVQSAGLAMFFMNERGLLGLNAASGWEVGTGPSVTFLGEGVQANATSTTLTQDVYAISFGQQGLMASLALNGTKITRINPRA